MMFWAFAKMYGMQEGIVPPDPWFDTIISFVTLEVGLIIGVVSLLVGIGLAVYALTGWGAEGFGPLSFSTEMRLVIPSMAAILIGFQIIYGSFFMSILEFRASRIARS